MTLPDRESITNQLQEAGLISKNPTPESKVLDEISSRITHGADEADAMRIELYLMDMIQIVKNGGNKSVEELLEEVKNSDGFRTAFMNFQISDEMTSELLSEVKEKLSTSD